jgi:capsular polysaccharide export protein
VTYQSRAVTRALGVPAKDNILYPSFGGQALTSSTELPPRILLLQGPVGPFFKALQSTLNDNGFDAWRMCFTTGDRVYSNKLKRVQFSEAFTEWSTWFEQFLTNIQFDCIVLFGSERPLHRVAIDIARRKNILVVSLEEGYIRPGFVTVELGGNNRRSPVASGLPPDSFDAASAPQVRQKYASFKTMCWHGFVYYTVNGLLSGFRERTTFHRQRALITEAFYWLRNVYRKFAHQGHNFATIEKLLEHHDKKYFVIPLQVSDDMQLGAAANGWSNEKLIIASITSFARSAPPDSRLVFKIHPLERGHSNARRLIVSLVDLHGVAERVDTIDTGSLGLLVRHCAGMLTINSTSGLSAIAHGAPLLAIGEAIYSRTPLADSAITDTDIDHFWLNKSSPDSRFRSRYLAWIKKSCLKPGDYYASDGIPHAIAGVQDVIQRGLALRRKGAPANAIVKAEKIRAGA